MKIKYSIVKHFIVENNKTIKKGDIVGPTTGFELNEAGIWDDVVPVIGNKYIVTHVDALSFHVQNIDYDEEEEGSGYVALHVRGSREKWIKYNS